MTEEEKQAKKCEYLQLLAQKDYIARKVVFETAEILKKLYPEVKMPEFEKYAEIENEAKEFRKFLADLN